MDGVPVDAFLLEEAIVLVHDFPQCLEVALGVIGKLVLVDAGCAEQQGGEEEKKMADGGFHRQGGSIAPSEGDAVGVLVVFEVVGFHLPVFTEVAHAEGGAPQLEVKGEVVIELWGAEGRGAHDVVVVVAAGEDLVVRLSVVGREGHADEGQGHVVVQGEWVAPGAQLPGEACGGVDAQRDACLCRIVAVAGVIGSAECAVDGTSGEQGQPWSSPVPAIHPSEP